MLELHCKAVFHLSLLTEEQLPLSCEEAAISLKYCCVSHQKV